MAAKKESMQITPDMKISDVMALNPDAADVMLSYGLHCVGCSINEFDTLEQGAVIHSMSDEDIQCLLDDLNDLFQDQKVYTDEGITVTERALKKIQEFQKIEKKEGWPLNIQFQTSEDGEKEFALDFVEKASSSHKQLLFEPIVLLFQKDTFPELWNLLIDYKEGPYEEGFLFRQRN